MLGIVYLMPYGENRLAFRYSCRQGLFTEAHRRSWALVEIYISFYEQVVVVVSLEETTTRDRHTSS